MVPGTYSMSSFGFDKYSFVEIVSGYGLSVSGKMLITTLGLTKEVKGSTEQLVRAEPLP